MSQNVNVFKIFLHLLRILYYMTETFFGRRDLLTPDISILSLSFLLIILMNDQIFS
jgi:hypothetical protein